jgi:hypothetical protein
VDVTDMSERPDPAPRLGDRPPPTPRWVKVFGAIAALLLALFLVTHLLGGGLRGHH